MLAREGGGRVTVDRRLAGGGGLLESASAASPPGDADAARPTAGSCATESVPVCGADVWLAVGGPSVVRVRSCSVRTAISAWSTLRMDCSASWMAEKPL